MMNKITLKKEKIYSGNLLLINAEYPLRNNDTKGMVPVDMRFLNILMKHNAANVLQLILEKISSENSIVPVSGYRSLREQSNIYFESLHNNGEEFTRKYVALPNHSEHQSGLAIDLGLNKEEIDFICPDFPYEGICEDFRKTAPNYGFIERYKKEKEEITGISHEPWHFRYVGYPHSKIMEDMSLALEEYVEFIKKYQADNALIYQEKNEAQVKVWYVPATDDEISISLPKNLLYQISGNNIDGFIVTSWRRA